MKLIKRIFCMHHFEYTYDYRGRFVRECRKCGRVKKI